jgi:lactobin A/cerein 7B family class IIb bacteriocin
MKTLDVNAFGVQELNAEEMKTVDGGINWGAIAAWVGGIILIGTVGPFAGFAEWAIYGLFFDQNAPFPV